MSPTGTPDAASSQSSEAWEPSKQPGAVAAALCVAFALLIGLGLYMFAWKKVIIHRRPFLPTSTPQRMPQNQYRLPVSIPLTRSRTIPPPTRPPLAKLAHSQLDADAQLATATTCSVCLDDFAAGTVVAQLPCGHIFCSECIEPWLMKHAVTCPLWLHFMPVLNDQCIYQLVKRRHTRLEVFFRSPSGYVPTKGDALKEAALAVRVLVVPVLAVPILAVPVLILQAASSRGKWLFLLDSWQENC